jgi:hypothetical protein
MTNIDLRRWIVDRIKSKPELFYWLAYLGVVPFMMYGVISLFLPNLIEGYIMKDEIKKAPMVWKDSADKLQTPERLFLIQTLNVIYEQREIDKIQGKTPVPLPEVTVEDAQIIRDRAKLKVQFWKWAIPFLFGVGLGACIKLPAWLIDSTCHKM